MARTTNCRHRWNWVGGSKSYLEKEAQTMIADAEEVGRMLHGLVASLERPTR